MTKPIEVSTYPSIVASHLQERVMKNESVLKRLSKKLVENVGEGKFLFVFGSGHSSILPLELYHRAGGFAFLVPLVADFLLPTAGPTLVRMLERIPGSANYLLDRSEPKPGEMIWIMSQSGINAAVVDLALEAKKRDLFTVAFSSLVHSEAVASRHPSGKKLYQICDELVDLGGAVGDAAIKVDQDVALGPLSTVSAICLAYSILTTAMAELERKGTRCSYTSVNTATGEVRNKSLEELVKTRDPLMR